MTRVLGLLGSPRSNGNTEKLLARFLAGAEDAGGQTLKLAVAELGIKGWTPDVACPDIGSPDEVDAFQHVSQELEAADVIAVASPVYFWNVPAQLKAIVDRSECQWIRKYIDKEPLPASSSGYDRRRGVFMSAAGTDRGRFSGTVQTIKSFFDVYEADYWGELLFDQVDEKEEIDEEPLALQQAYDLGFRAVTEAWR
jgi:multimeric flavodoxin WrbA